MFLILVFVADFELVVLFWVCRDFLQVFCLFLGVPLCFVYVLWGGFGVLLLGIVLVTFGQV